VITTRCTISTSGDIGGDANLEFVDKFCHLGDMLSVDGDAVCEAVCCMEVRPGPKKGK